MVVLSDIPFFGLNGLHLVGARLCKVHDGDTLTVAHHMGAFAPLRRVTIRLKDINAPELKGKTTAAARAARLALIEAIRDHEDPSGKYDEAFFQATPCLVDVSCGGFDCFGRVIGDVSPTGGDPVSPLLLRNPLFAPYVKKRVARA